MYLGEASSTYLRVKLGKFPLELW